MRRPFLFVRCSELHGCADKQFLPTQFVLFVLHSASAKTKHRKGSAARPEAPLSLSKGLPKGRL